jgi:hypothetical protein
MKLTYLSRGTKPATYNNGQQRIWPKLLWGVYPIPHTHFMGSLARHDKFAIPEKHSSDPSLTLEHYARDERPKTRHTAECRERNSQTAIATEERAPQPRSLSLRLRHGAFLEPDPDV